MIEQGKLEQIKGVINASIELEDKVGKLQQGFEQTRKQLDEEIKNVLATKQQNEMAIANLEKQKREFEERERKAHANFERLKLEADRDSRTKLEACGANSDKLKRQLTAESSVFQGITQTSAAKAQRADDQREALNNEHEELNMFIFLK